KLFIFNIEANTHEEIENLPDGVIESISMINNTDFVFSVNTPTIAGDIWKYSLVTATAKRITYISHSGTLNHRLLEPNLQSFQSFDGLEVPYFYYTKDCSKQKPAVIYVHGGPASQTRAEFNYYVQY